MEFKEWYTKFIESQNPLSSMTAEQMLEKAFDAGMKNMEEQLPLIGKDTQTGELVEIPREKTPELGDEKKFISDDELESFDLKMWLEENEEFN